MKIINASLKLAPEAAGFVPSAAGALKVTLGQCAAAPIADIKVAPEMIATARSGGTATGMPLGTRMGICPLRNGQRRVRR